jgi:hypothetical protein
VSSLSLMSDVDFMRLYSTRDLARIARMLHVGSKQGRTEMKDTIQRIVRAYDAEIFEFKSRELARVERNSLLAIQKRVAELELVIAKAPDRARWEVASALSQVRPERHLSSGEAMLEYGHPLSNEGLFDRESLAFFMTGLLSIQRHVTDVAEQLAKSSRRPREPERQAVRDVLALWRVYRREEPKLSGRARKFTGEFIELCELVLRPVAKRHDRDARFDAHAHRHVYV